MSRVEVLEASVGNTMVLPEQRGHCLGLATKLATHRALMAAHPQCLDVHTGNADVNQHMNAINEEMGYRRLEDILVLQKHLEAPRPAASDNRSRRPLPHP